MVKKSIWSIILIVISLAIFIIGIFIDNNNTLLSSVIFLFGGIFGYILFRPEDKITLSIFLISFFTFLLSRSILPHITNMDSFVNYNLWDRSWSFNEEVWRHIYISLFLSLLFVYFGFVAGNKQNIKQSKSLNYDNYEFKRLRNTTKSIFYLTAIPSLIVFFEKGIFVFSNTYNALYSSFNSILPAIITNNLLVIYELSFIIFLASMPSKSESKKPLIVFLIISIISLGTGQRNSFVINLLFIITYLIIRNNTYSRDEIWFSKKQKKIFLASIPFGIVLLFSFGYSRNILNLEIIDFWNSIKGFFYQQGASVNIIGYGYQHDSSIPDKLFSLKPILDLFDRTNSFTIQDRTDYAMYGNSFGSVISYNIIKEDYLRGFGLGSCYIAEVWHDFGYIGIVFWNFLFGYILSSIRRWSKKSIAFTTFALFAFMGIIYAPRAMASDFFSPLFSFTNLFLGVLLYFYYVKKKKQRKYNELKQITSLYK